MGNALMGEKPQPRNALIGPYTPSLRERASYALQDIMEALGLPRYSAMRKAEAITGTGLGMAPEIARGLGLADLTPLGGAFARQEQSRTGQPVGPSAPQGLLNEAAIVWHGSPHRFDKFDSKKIGTGEGAQAYGHGVYFAESPDVAKSYQQVLGGTKPTYRVGAAEVDRAALSDIDKLALNIVARPKEYTLRALEDAGLPPGVISKVQQAAKRFSGATYEDVPLGSLYKVDLPDSMIARMLDWDKPLSQQAPAARAALQRAYRELGLTFPAKAATPKAGAGIYDDVAKGFNLSPNSRQEAANSRQMASDYLRELGIPGIRYLDGGSRGAGSGTSNFVVFPGEENALRILERNGLPLR